MRWLAWGSFDTRRHPRAGVLVDGLRAHGHEVVQVTRPLGLSTAQRVRVLQQPWRVVGLALRVLRCWVWLARHGRRAARDLQPDAVLIGYLGHFDVLLASVLFRRTTIVHDMLVFSTDTARDRGTRGIVIRLLAGLDRLAVAASDVVVLDTLENVTLLPSRCRPRACVVTVGAAPEWFAARPAARDGRGVDVIFFGLFTPLQGAVTIGQAAGLLADEPQVRITMVGSGQDLDAAKAAAAANLGVTWVAWVEPEDLPGMVARYDVCLGIFARGGKGARVVPNKIFQGAAAGCALVTSDTPPQRRALGDAAVFVPPGDAAALAGELRALAGDPARLLELRAAAASVADRRFSPAVVVEPLLARVEVRSARRNPNRPSP